LRCGGESARAVRAATAAGGLPAARDLE